MHHVRLAGKRRIAKLYLQRINGDRDKYGDTKSGLICLYGFLPFPGGGIGRAGRRVAGPFCRGAGQIFCPVSFFACFPVFICGNKEAGPGILPGH